MGISILCECACACVRVRVHVRVRVPHTQELRSGLVWAEHLDLLHVLGHHVEPLLRALLAVQLGGHVLLHLPPEAQREG